VPYSKPAIFLGSLLAAVFTAFNCYVGLRLGWLVCVSIPATIFSLRVLHGVLRLGGARDAAIAQAIASASHAVTGSLLFILPALLLSGGWNDFHFLPSVGLGLIGGILGVLLSSPVDTEALPFPEAKACETVLSAEEKSFAHNRPLLGGVVTALLLKWQTSPFGALQDRLETLLFARGYPLYFGTEVSAAGIAIGYFLKAEMSLLLFVASALGWWVAIPWAGLPAQSSDLLPFFWKTWNEHTRFLGVGAMIPAGIWAIVQSRERIFSFLHTFQEQWKIRPLLSYFTLFAPLALLVAVQWWALRQFLPSVEISVVSLLASFLLTAIACHLVGILGTGMAPFTGIAVLAVLGLGGCLFALGVQGVSAVTITLLISAVPITAAFTAAGLAQDFRIGRAFGVGERELKTVKLIGIVVSAITLPLTLKLLHQAYGIGTGQPGALLAAPASLASFLAYGIFHPADLPLKFLLLGAVLGVVAHGLDQVLAIRQARFRLPVMVFAAGLYLPFPLAVIVAIGGAMELLTRKKFPLATGPLIAAGLLVGDALGALIQAALQLLAF